MMTSTKIAFWDIAPYSLVEVDWRFRGAYCLHYQGDDIFQGFKQMKTCIVNLFSYRYSS
jgi:hypothetical protein